MSHLSSHVRANNHLLFADAAESLLQADKFSKKKEEFNDSYDTSNILRHHGTDEYVGATLSLYLDILNLFIFILNLLGMSRD